MANDTTIGTFQSEDELCATAVKRLKDKRDFKAHLLAYVMVNLLPRGDLGSDLGGVLLAGLPALRLGHRSGLPRLGRVLTARVARADRGRDGPATPVSPRSAR